VERAHSEVERLRQRYVPSRVPEKVKDELRKRMEDEARRYGMNTLPETVT